MWTTEWVKEENSKSEKEIIFNAKVSVCECVYTFRVYYAYARWVLHNCKRAYNSCCRFSFRTCIVSFNIFFTWQKKWKSKQKKWEKKADKNCAIIFIWKSVFNMRKFLLKNLLNSFILIALNSFNLILFLNHSKKVKDSLH